MLLPHVLYIVTGANKGFGKVIAETIARQSKVKTSIVLVGRDLSQLESIELKQENVSCYCIGNACLESAVEAEKTVIDQVENLLRVIEEEELKREKRWTDQTWDFYHVELARAR